MQLLQRVGALASLVFAAVGLFWLCQPGTFNMNQILSILGLFSALSVSMGLYLFHLRTGLPRWKSGFGKPDDPASTRLTPRGIHARRACNCAGHYRHYHRHVRIYTGLSVLASAHLSATNKKMAAIENALMAFRVANNRIPCPADLTIVEGAANYGVEAAIPGTCSGGTPAANFTSGTAAEGAVPTATLGLSADFMYDGWGNRFRYAVDTAMTAAGIFSTTPLGANCGPLTVSDVNGNARSTKAMYAIVSHGANGHGAYTKNGATLSTGSVNANELINCHCHSDGTANTYAPTYVQAQASKDPSNALNAFDDIVVYKERWQLRTDWDKTGGSCMAIYVADSGNNRIEKFDANGNFLLAFGSYGAGNGQLYSPLGIATDSSGNVWVADKYNARIEKFDSNGNYLSQFGTAGSGNGQLNGPVGVAIDSSGNLWVADPGNQRVQKFDSNGTYLAQFGSSGTGNGQFGSGYSGSPQGIAIDSGGNIWASDYGNGSDPRVEKFDSNGTYLLQFPSYTPTGLAFDATGNVLVSLSNEGWVEKHDSSGTYLTQFGSGGSGNGNFFGNTDIAIDSGGNIWVVDSGNNRVQKFDSSGSYLSQFGSAGSGNGQFNSPWGIAISGR